MMHALINLTREIGKNVNKGNNGCSIFVDLQKAFDTVEHILLSKQKHYSIYGTANDWIESCPFDRIRIRARIISLQKKVLGIINNKPRDSSIKCFVHTISKA